MRKLTVTTLREYESTILEGLGDAGIVQLRKVEVPEFESFREEVAEERGELEELSDKFRLLYERLIGDEKPKPTKRVSVTEDELASYISETEHKVEGILTKLGGKEEELEELRRRRGELEKGRETFEALAKRGVKVSRIGEFEKTFVKGGLIARQLVPKLKKYLGKLKDLSYKITPVSTKKSFLTVSGPLTRKAWVEAVFAVLKVEEFLPVDPSEVKNTIESTDGDIRRVEKDRLVINGELNTIKQDFANHVESIRSHLMPSLSGASSMVFRSKMVSIIEGWVPLDRIPILNKLFKDLEERVEGALIVEYRDPKPGEEPPSIVENPRIIKPFEVLTRLYGTPTYYEIDPTPILTVLYILQFGIMFGDVGEGIVLVIMGIIAGFIMKGGMARTIGKLLIGVGITSTIFGFLYGELFLMEFMHPILFSPLHDLMAIIWLSIYFGIASIITALVLGTINAFKAGHKVEALIGQHGIAALVFYVFFIYSGLRFVRMGMQLSALFHWSLYVAIGALLLVFVSPVVGAVIRHEGGLFEKLMEGFGHAFVIAIEFLVNTISYVRLAAFAIAHGALALVASAMSVLLGIGGPIFANIIAMSVELLSTTVQALRLIYYEFMGKFYKGSGTPFQPFRFEARSTQKKKGLT